MKDVIQNINHQFYNFVTKYDLTNDNIIRKIIHTNTVADNCFIIACKLNFNETDRNLAYLAGILHDIGRFEQWKLYNTYNDHQSIDHGDLSYNLANKFDLSMFSNEDVECIKLAVKYHTKKYLGNNKRVILFNEIILNADAYSNVLNTANGSQRMTVTEDGVTKEILDNFLSLNRLWKYSPKTKMDRALMLTACTYYVKYTFLRKNIIENNFIDIISEQLSKYLNDNDKKIYFEAVSTLKKRYLDENYIHNIDR